jgi:hypothetical protein
LCPKCKKKKYWVDESLATPTKGKYAFYSVHGCIACGFVKTQITCTVCLIPESNGFQEDGIFTCTRCRASQKAEEEYQRNKRDGLLPNWQCARCKEPVCHCDDFRP